MVRLLVLRGDGKMHIMLLLFQLYCGTGVKGPEQLVDRLDSLASSPHSMVTSHRDVSGTRWPGNSLSMGAPFIWAFHQWWALRSIPSLSEALHYILSRPPAPVYSLILLQVAEQAWESF